MKLPEMTPVKSSHLQALGHNGTGLFVRFKDSRVYHYPGVPKDVFEGALEAPSVGSWFAGSVKGRFPGYRLDDDEIDAG